MPPSLGGWFALSPWTVLLSSLIAFGRHIFPRESSLAILEGASRWDCILRPSWEDERNG